MIIDDENCRVSNIFAGFVGVFHDMEAFMNFNIWLKHSNYFSGREYLLVDTDTSYPFARITTTSYIKPKIDDPISKQFNSKLSSICVKAEYAIGQQKRTI
jgi:hypothetical protein